MIFLAVAVTDQICATKVQNQSGLICSILRQDEDEDEDEVEDEVEDEDEDEEEDEGHGSSMTGVILGFFSGAA